MSNGLIALFFGLGVTGWVYSQLAHRSGNSNPSSTLTASAVVGLLAAILIYTVFRFVLNFH